MTNPLSASLTLPGGAVLKNRIAKAAMSEGLADADNQPTARLETLYRRWARSGAGLLLSGNIQVDRDHLERPNNVVIDERSDGAALARMARAGREGGAHFWAQLSHTGRQVAAEINAAPLSSSEVEIDVIRGAGFNFAPPVAMSQDQIIKAIDQFAYAAARAKAAGFTGVSLHAAHGYLISQFLSPLSNRRDDQWGGSLKNRARLLYAVVEAVRAAVGPGFPIGIKLNASDFQKGGFSNAECLQVVAHLNTLGVDLLELSGGSLEQPKVVGVAIKDQGEDAPKASTVAREAYFLEFARGVRAVATMPVMVTGGFRTVAGMVQALEDGELDVVGLGRPMIANPDAPAQILAGEIERLPTPEAGLDLFHILPWNTLQLERMGDGLEPDLAMGGQDAAERFVALETRNVTDLVTRRAEQAR